MPVQFLSTVIILRLPWGMHCYFKSTANQSFTKEHEMLNFDHIISQGHDFSGSKYATALFFFTIFLLFHMQSIVIILRPLGEKLLVHIRYVFAPSDFLKILFCSFLLF